MTTQSTCAAILIVLLGPGALAQRFPTNVPRNWQASHLPAINTNVPQGTSRDFLAASSRHRLLTDFQAGVATLRVNGTSYPFANDRFTPNGFQRGSSPALAKFSPQSQIAVIDTAIVRSLGGSFVFPPTPADTTRHLYSFDANAKRTVDLTQKLRGDLWVDTVRQTNTYDANGKQTSYLYELWSTGQWVNSFRYTYTYDASGNNLSELYESWSTGQWVNTWRFTYTYDAGSNMLTHMYEDWSNDQWVNGERGTYTYDAGKNMLSYLYESWSSGQWVNRERGTFTYDTEGNMLSTLHESWSNGQLLNASRSTYTYDAQGNMLWGLYEYWSAGQWVNSGRSTYTYDANGKQTSYLGEGWSNGQWVNSERGTFTYNANGKQTSYLYELWSTGQWENFKCGTFTFDASGNKLSELYESWSNGQWDNYERFTYTCDDQGNLTSVWHYSWLNSSWTPTNIGWTSQGGNGFAGTVTDSAGNYYDFGLAYNFTFTRKPIVSGVASQSGNVPAMYSLSQNYPNPFNPSTSIKYELPKASDLRLSVFDLLGREVAVLVNERRDSGAHEVKFDGSNLASGVYFYRLEAGDFVQSKKLVLLK
jgi:hypothetical protein